MNTQILQKCVDELKKDSPNIPYILGTLETLIEMLPIQPGITSNPKVITRTETIADETITVRSPITELGPIAKLS